MSQAAGGLGIRQLFRYTRWKGIVDRALALTAIAALSPLMGLISGAIALDSRGGPIFRQERVGKNGRKFTVYKFRTMDVSSDDSEYRQYVASLISQGLPYEVDPQGRAIYKMADDPRVTRVGAFLRRTNLDELPQLFNVLRGDMSCVGPRPDIPFAVKLYRDWHRKRLSATPGITGLWQVSGRSTLSFDEMVQLDIEYVENQSALLDFRILLQTIGVILTRDGSYQHRKETGNGECRGSRLRLLGSKAREDPSQLGGGKSGSHLRL